MLIIPVLDIQKGLAVHARGGNRDHYAPLRSILHEGADPVELARAMRDTQHARNIYVADLDAIAGREPNWGTFAAILGLGMFPLVDVGLRHAGDLDDRLLVLGSSVVAGLETVQGPSALAEIVARAGPGRVVFSLDLRDGRPMVPTAESWGTQDPLDLARMAWDSGVAGLILLDLARVGAGRGVGTQSILKALLRERPEAKILVGGGISGPEEVLALARAGASGVLVGSAIHDGRIRCY